MAAKAAKPEGTKKSIFNIDPSIKKRLKYIAAVDEKWPDQTKIVNQALADFIEKWEKKNGKIPIK